MIHRGAVLADEFFAESKVSRGGTLSGLKQARSRMPSTLVIAITKDVTSFTIKINTPLLTAADESQLRELVSSCFKTP